jgi:hypothetical protein
MFTGTPICSSASIRGFHSRRPSRSACLSRCVTSLPPFGISCASRTLHGIPWRIIQPSRSSRSAIRSGVQLSQTNASPLRLHRIDISGS